MKSLVCVMFVVTMNLVLDETYCNYDISLYHQRTVTGTTALFVGVAKFKQQSFLGYLSWINQERSIIKATMINHMTLEITSGH